MIEELKNILLAGLGSAAYTYEKATKSIEELVKKGRITMEEGKELAEELKSKYKDKANDLLAEVEKKKNKDNIDKLKSKGEDTLENLKDISETISDEIKESGTYKKADNLAKELKIATIDDINSVKLSIENLDKKIEHLTNNLNKK